MAQLQTFQGVYLWQYLPNLTASIVLAAVFGIATLYHTWKIWRSRTWFWAPFVVGGICEILGYITRAVAYDMTGSLAVYILQATLLLLPPIFFAASMYMIYSRIVRAVEHGAAFSLVPPRLSTRIFVIGDLVCLNIQGNGAGLLANPETAHIGKPIVVAGLIFQVILFFGFIFMCCSFHRRFAAHLAEARVSCDVPWRKYLHVLYCTSIAILGRNVYRVVEYIMGDDGYLMRVEWPIFVGDAAPMFMVMVAFGIWYPSRLIKTLDM